MTSTSTRWGELPLDPDTEPGIAAIEREHITKPRPMELDGPLLHQPSAASITGTSSSDLMPIECLFGDPLIMHTIQLNQYTKKMRSMLSAIKQEKQSEDKQCEDDNEVQFFPTLPVMEFADKELTHKKPLLDCCFDRFRLGIGNAPPEINEQIAKKILRRALAVMCAHAGFETTTESILEILVDVTSEFYLKLTRLLRANVDREALVGGTNFPDVMEEALYGVGIGSMRNLLSFYKTRVIDYHSHMMQTCHQLDAAHRKLKSPPEELIVKQEPLEELKKPTIKLNSDVEPDVPQIHFPAASDYQLLDDGDINQTEESGAVATLHLEELPQLQVAFEQETGNRITVDDDSVTNKVEQTPGSDLIQQLATNGVPNLYCDDEVVNVIDSPSQATESAVMIMSGSDPHLSAMLDQPHTPGINLDMKLFKGSKKT